MKLLLCAINTQFVHTNPAVRALAACCRDLCDTRVQEYTINQPNSIAFSNILQEKPDILGFSCYIWNISQVLQLSQDLKSVCPEMKIILGGPEVTFRARTLLQDCPWIDCVVCGEAEETLPELVQAYANNRRCTCPGVVYPDGGDETCAAVHDLDRLPAPTPEDLSGRIVYYESSRGCPFSCAYCLSGALGGGVRTRSLERIRQDLTDLCQSGAKVVKFVDRTFNANPGRAVEIVSFILEHTGDMAFHFEIGADLLSEDLLSLLERAPVGKLQVEAGIQSFHPQTLESVCRKTNETLLCRNLTRLIAANSVHVHVDLIAGLPHEDFETFGHSFDRAWALHAHCLQLGFLKRLSGASLEQYMEQWGLVFRSYPPYEVLKSGWMSAPELCRLKRIAELLERLENSGKALRASEYLAQCLGSPFAFYCALEAWCTPRGLCDRPLGIDALFDMLAGFAKDTLSEADYASFLRLLRLDLLSAGASGARPSCFAGEPHPSDVLQLLQSAGIDTKPLTRFEAAQVNQNGEIQVYIAEKRRDMHGRRILRRVL